MTERPFSPATCAILLDIEGTVGDVRFVHDVLFPYARARIGTFLEEHKRSSDVSRIVEETRAIGHLATTDADAIVAQLIAWSDANEKRQPLKELQGLIWERGYREGELHAHLYPDVLPSIQEWRNQGLVVAIYSSGSVFAQKLYFEHTVFGDVTPFLGRYFDTTTGAKGDVASYTRIAEALALAPSEIGFFSDSLAEVNAARAAGISAVRVDRTRDVNDEGLDGPGARWCGGLRGLGR